MKFTLIAVALTSIWFTGCASESQHRQSKAMTNPSVQPRIEFLYFNGCPNHVGLRRALDEAVDDSGNPIRYAAFDMETLAATDPRLRWGSPTILVNGSDLFGLAPATDPSLTCRFYPDGTPTAEDVAAKIVAGQ